MSKISVDTDLIRELAALIEESGLTELEIEDGDYKLRLSRGGGIPVPVQMGMAPAGAQAAQAATAPAVAVETAAPDMADHAGAVKSPMVGTAYIAPEPGADPFVKVGDNVTQGQTVMIIEAMKTMNPIPAPQSGKVSAILVSDGQPVEFGEVLLLVE